MAKRRTRRVGTQHPPVMNANIHDYRYDEPIDPPVEWLDDPIRDRDLMLADLLAIGEALGIGARPYSGHDAVQRDYLPRIRHLMRLKRRAK